MESEKTTPRATKPTVVAAYCRHYASRVPSSGIIRDTCSQNTYSLDFEPMEANVEIGLTLSITWACASEELGPALRTE